MLCPLLPIVIVVAVELPILIVPEESIVEVVSCPLISKVLTPVTAPPLVTFRPPFEVKVKVPVEFPIEVSDVPVALSPVPRNAVVPPVPTVPNPVMVLLDEFAVILPIEEIFWLPPVIVPVSVAAPNLRVPAVASRS